MKLRLRAKLRLKKPPVRAKLRLKLPVNLLPKLLLKKRSTGPEL